MCEDQVIGAAYARMSTEMQNEKSPDDQVRVCRERARGDRAAIPDENVFIDRAVSGTKPDRDALAALKAAAKAKRFSVLYFEDLSRLGRESTHLMFLLKELVYDGIRVISVNEGIDSANDSWHILATILGLQHEQYVRDLGHRVRRGQAGAVLDNLSAGDICFGYASEPIPGSEKTRRGRDGRPQKRVIIDADKARWVIKIFEWFALERMSMQGIADKLTQLEVPKDHRASTTGWHHDYVKRILTREKYIGKWTWGKRRNKRNPTTGKVKQEAVPSKDHVVVPREELRIVPQELWDAAQARLRKIKDVYPGPNGAAGREGASYVDAYPKNEFSGLLFCASCDARFVVAGSHGRYMACGGIRMHRCDVHTHVPRALLRSILIDCMRREITATRERVDAIVEATQRLVAEAVARRPSELDAPRADHARVEGQIANLLAVAESGVGCPQSIARRIRELDDRQNAIRGRIDSLRSPRQPTPAVPTRDWLLAELHHLEEWIADDPRELAQVFRALAGGRIQMIEVIPRGKKRGYFTARFRAHVLGLLAERNRRLGAASDSDPTGLASGQLEPEGTEYTIDIVRPARSEELAEEVYRLRAQGFQWKDLRKQLGCGYATVKAAFAMAKARRES